MRKTFRLIALVTFLLGMLSVPTLSQEDDNRLQIVASYSILADVVSNVVGDAADVTSLMPVNADPHTFTPTPRDLTALADADIVFVNGANFEEGIMEAIENADTDINLVTTSQCVQILPFGASGHSHTHGDDHEEHDHEEHDHEEHDHEEHDHEGEMTTGIVSAAYMQIANTGNTDDTLVAVRASGINTIEIHETTVEDGIARMRQLEDGITLPAGETAEFRPGGLHVMLIDIQQDLITDETLAITLEFASGRQVPVAAQIREFPPEDGITIATDDLTISNVWARPTASAGIAMEDMAMDEADSENAALCAQYISEMAAIHDADHEHENADADHQHNHGGNPINEAALGMLYAVACEGHDHEHEDADADADHQHEGEMDHDHEHAEGACDPHVWMEPHNPMYWTMLIRDALTELDPANAEVYRTNADVYLQELDALAHDFVMEAVETVPADNRILVTNHEFLGYFAVRYGFEVVGTVIPAGATGAEPSAASIAALIDAVNEEGVSAIFAETTVSTDIAEQIAEETGVQVLTLYSGSLSDADGPASTYIDYMRFNVTTIVEALGGSVPTNAEANS